MRFFFFFFFFCFFGGLVGVRPCALRCKGVDQQLSPGFNLRIRSVRVVVEAGEGGKNDTDGGGREGGIGEVLYNALKSLELLSRVEGLTG